MALYTELPIYHKTYELLSLITTSIKHFPRDLKFSLGDRLRNECVDLVVFIYKANSNQNKVPYLKEILDRIQVIQLLTRLAKDLHCLSIKKFSEISMSIQSLSKQTSGWLKSQSFNNQIEQNGAC
jgi:hypothetical protein